MAGSVVFQTERGRTHQEVRSTQCGGRHGGCQRNRSFNISSSFFSLFPHCVVVSQGEPSGALKQPTALSPFLKSPNPNELFLVLLVILSRQPIAAPLPISVPTSISRPSLFALPSAGAKASQYLFSKPGLCEVWSLLGACSEARSTKLSRLPHLQPKVSWPGNLHHFSPLAPFGAHLPFHLPSAALLTVHFSSPPSLRDRTSHILTLFSFVSETTPIVWWSSTPPSWPRPT